ncbi:hypothetical protein BJ912DRAFT_930669 [Pholiota molesta]|nr:hypothetical protein BJ912DRAFT_930669 [Pholiota molesta]
MSLGRVALVWVKFGSRNVIGEMVMETWKSWSGLAFWKYKDWRRLEGICTILTHRNAIPIAHSLPQWWRYVLMIVDTLDHALQSSNLTFGRPAGGGKHCCAWTISVAIDVDLPSMTNIRSTGNLRYGLLVIGQLIFYLDFWFSCEQRRLEIIINTWESQTCEHTLGSRVLRHRHPVDSICPFVAVSSTPSMPSLHRDSTPPADSARSALIEDFACESCSSPHKSFLDDSCMWFITVY